MKKKKKKKKKKKRFNPNIPKRHVNIIYQISALFGLPDVHQQANKSMTLLGITQNKPKRLKRALYIA